MEKLNKICWVLRALVYKIFFGSLGFPSYIGKPIMLYRVRSIFIGRGARIFPGLRAEVFGVGRLTIHDDVAIGQGFHVTCMGNLNIGPGCLITGYVTVTDIEHNYEDVELPVLQQGVTYKRTSIGENCFIGMGARIQAGTVLGKGCIVGANAVVRGVFPDHCVIVGAPARAIKRYDPALGAWVRCNLAPH